jgi:hypothetical protein
MRLLLFSLLIMVCGCTTVVTQDTRTSYVMPENRSIYVTAKSRGELSVIITCPGDSAQFSILPEQSTLIDAAGQKYRLEFHPGRNAASPTSCMTYSVRAFGPLPTNSPHRFNRNPYTLSVAYIGGGGRNVAETKITVNRRMKRLLPHLNPAWDL